VRNRTTTRKLGPIRAPGSRDGLTPQEMAEARLRKLMSEVTVAPVYELLRRLPAAAQRQRATPARTASTATPARSSAAGRGRS
jgi:hypothetical protein